MLKDFGGSWDKSSNTVSYSPQLTNGPADAYSGVISVTAIVHDVAGHMQMTQKANVYQGENLVSLPLNSSLRSGMYAVEVNNGNERQSGKFMKQ